MHVLATHKKAYADYEVLETFEAGLSLLGFEVKSVRAGHMDLHASYVVLRGGEAFLLNAKIYPLAAHRTPQGYEPGRTRKLLLQKKELSQLLGKTSQKGLTLVPLRVYTKGRFIKLDIALARGRKEYEKRERIKKRESEREMQRFLKT